MPTRVLRPARRGVSLVFFVYGGVLATWVSRIPLIKTELGLDTAELSLALLGSPVGLIVAMQLVARLVERFTSATVARGALLAACVAMVLPSLAWSLPSLAAALLLLGMSLGALDIAMNTQGVAIERGYGRPIMSGIHGSYSVGVLVGAGVGALAAGAELAPLAHFAAAAAILTALGLLGARSLLGGEADAAAEPKEEEAGAAAKPLTLASHPGLIALGIVAFCCLFAEGAVDDWSGVYLHEVQGASLGVAPLAAAACGAGMAIGRFGGDAVIARYGRAATLWRAGLIGGGGMTLAVLAPAPAVAIAGYGILGLGVATIVPIAFTLAGNTRGVPPAWAISRVTTLGYAGLFSSPPVIGLIAQGTGLGVALAVPAVLLLIVALLSRTASERRGPERMGSTSRRLSA
jgi:predicted MFS family arabinose efflux permease